ncbi:Sapep family Mn(2+)-dependent dipeptidase [Fusibacter bizertensis]
MKIDKVLNDKIDKFIEKYKSKIIDDICDLVKIRSVSVDGTDTPPYGKECRAVLDKAIEISKNMGFEIDNCDYYCASASLKSNDNGPFIGFWGHLDVVPEGEGWTYPPYSPTLLEGYIVGRGANDNKGPSICSLYTLLFFAENDYDLKYNYKVIFGTNEERGMEDVEYYKKHRELPIFSIVADSVFPICYAEKGILSGIIEIPLLSDEIIQLSGGVARNAVPNYAEVKLKKSCNLNRLALPPEISVEDSDNCYFLKATGKSAHASSPEGSINAIHLLTSYLKNQMLSEDANKSLSFISDITGSFNGSSFGINYNDGITGDLTCVIGLMTYKNNKVTLTVDIRYPIKTDVDFMIKNIEKYCNQYGGRLYNVEDSKPVYVDPKDRFVVLLNDLYNDIMETDIPPYYEGGGSYARKLPNSLAFGPILHERKPKPKCIAHGGAHKPDESLAIDELLVALKIYIVTVLKIDRIEF